MRLGFYASVVVLAVIAQIFIVSVSPTAVFAETVEELQSKINTRGDDISRLEKEIAAYQVEIENLGKKERSLSTTLKELDLTQRKLQADITITEDRIDTKNLEIAKLSDNIGGTVDQITEDRRYISESFKKMAEGGTNSFLGILLAGRSIAGVWDSVNQLALVGDNLQNSIDELSAKKITLEDAKSKTLKAKAELVSLQKQLGNKKAAVLSTKAEQNKLLKDTKSSESSFQAILSEKLRLKEAFERELSQYESDLKLSVDSSQLPSTGRSVLAWPLDSVHITQYFGNTPYATANAQLYSGAGHNGIDLRATIGTPIRASLGGTIVGQGNTDIYSGCYSLGKWILINHPNGLTTLYAHLSVQTVLTGANVGTGEIIGYSGNTGYTTGPHLHFGVYATSGIEIKRFSTSKNCKGATIPIAVFSAYLNPLSYLPAL